MDVSWTQSAQELVDRVGAGMDALWALTYAAQGAALQLALLEPLDEDMSLTAAGMDLAEALGELEWARPELAACTLAIEVGPAPLDDVTGCREALGGLLRAAIDVVERLLRGGEELTRADLLAVARAVHLIAAAHTRITGRLP